MPSYLVESYADGASVGDAQSRARRAAECSDCVRYVRTTFVPDDEVILHLFEAPSLEALDRAGQLAELQFERIVEAVERTPDGLDGGHR